MICNYGCGTEATHQFKNGKWCCSKNVSLCPAIIKIISDSRLGDKNVMKRREVVDKVLDTKRKKWNIRLAGPKN